MAAPAWHAAGGLVARPPVMLREDDFHRLLEHRARRSALGAQPQREVIGMHAEVARQVLPAAFHHLALLQDAGAHLGPAGFMLHGDRLSNTYAGLQGPSSQAAASSSVRKRR